MRLPRSFLPVLLALKVLRQRHAAHWMRWHNLLRCCCCCWLRLSLCCLDRSLVHSVNLLRGRRLRVRGMPSVRRRCQRRRRGRRDGARGVGHEAGVAWGAQLGNKLRKVCLPAAWEG